jgi:trigger factor
MGESSVKITTHELGNQEVELTIEVDDGRVDQVMRTLARRYAREVRIPGFRPGKAPYAFVAQRVGQDRLLQEALEEIGPQIYQEALQEAGIEPYDLPPLELSSYDPLTLTVKLPLAPRAELGDYHLIQVDPPSVEVTEAEIDEVLREYQEENAQLVPVNRGARLDDQVILDLRIEIDGRAMYDQKNISFVLSHGGFSGVPNDFFEQVAGMGPGEKQQFVLTYPENFDAAELAGKVGTFTVFLHEVKERELPELDDEFAQTLGELETLQELRDKTRETLMARAEIQANNELAETVLTKVTEMATVEYPRVALEHETDHLTAELEGLLRDRGLTLDNYLLIEGLTRDQLRERQRPDAERRLTRSIVLSEVVRREGIEVSDEEIDEEIETIAALYGANAAQVRASLSTDESRRSIRSRLLAQKAIDRLVAIATGKVVPQDVGGETPMADNRNAVDDATNQDLPTTIKSET